MSKFKLSFKSENIEIKKWNIDNTEMLQSLHTLTQIGIMIGVVFLL